MDAHTVVAFESGLSQREVRALRECPSPTDDVFTDPVEAALIHWVDAVSTGTGAISDAVSTEAHEQLGDHRLVELTVTVGATMLLNRLATGLQLPTSAETLTGLAERGYRTYNPGTHVSIGVAS